MMQSAVERQEGWHVAIIMDGNGRWATRRRLPRSAGHRAGVKTVRKVVEAAPGLGITTLTLFAFSSDNWRRPPDEVSALMRLLSLYLGRETARCIEQGVRLDDSRLLELLRQVADDGIVPILAAQLAVAAGADYRDLARLIQVIHRLSPSRLLSRAYWPLSSAVLNIWVCAASSEVASPLRSFTSPS